MTTSTAVRPANGKTHSTQALSAFSVRFRQKRPDVNLYVTALPLKALIGRFHSDTYRPDNRSGYQRPVTPSRVRQISSYLRAEEGMLPTSVLLCIRQPDRAQFEVAVQGDAEHGGGETGLLTIPPEV